MDYSISPMTTADREAAIDIFNHYVENSYAAYTDLKIPYAAFDNILQMSQGLPAAAIRDKNRKLIGFGLLRPYNPMPTFSHTAEITYFLSPDHTGKGFGTHLLNYLVEEGRKKGLKNILANISSLNPASIQFHKKNGFCECGRFQNICRKNNRNFDVVWMQKVL